jgi:hypothetical protein
MAYRDYFQELNDLRAVAYNDNDEVIQNDIMKMDKGFMEAWKTEGWLPAVAAYLGKSVEPEMAVSVIGRDGIAKTKQYQDAVVDILNESNSFGDKVKAGFKILKMSYSAKKGEQPSPYFNYRGGLNLKFDKRRPDGKGYSKDFHAAAISLINDYAHVKHMSPLVPLFDSVQFLYEKGFDSSLPNVAKFIESEMQDKIYQNQKAYSLGQEIDFVLRFLRRLGSLTTMAFNVPANAVNIAIGNYNNWRQEGVGHVLKGNKRMFFEKRGGQKAGEMAISKKALDILRQYNIIQFDAESNPRINGAKLFDKMAYFFNQIGEYQIQGSMFLGFLTKDEWNSFELKDGKYQLKEGVDKKDFEDKMQSYKDAVSAIQGKYDEKDRRMFMRGEAGKSIAQFKTWMPDWYKSRFGKEFVNKYGVTERGSFNMFTKSAIAEIKNDFKDGGFKIENGIPVIKNKQIARNLRGMVTIATLYILSHSGDDEDKKKKKKQYYDTLSLENTLGNLLFVFDPDQLNYLIKNPVAIQGTVTKFIDAFSAAIDGDGKKFKKSMKKITPYNKVYDQLEKVGKK